jgi:hypothetical protein
MDVFSESGVGGWGGDIETEVLVQGYQIQTD